jgi:hypothetical protein
MAMWVISAGADGRDYTEYFRHFGMAFVGGESQRAAMRQVKVGDVILLKRGLREIVAAGTVVERNGRYSGDGDKEWLRDFDGWDLAGYCYVDWHVPATPEPSPGLRMGTIYQTSQPQHIATAQKILGGPSQRFQNEPPPTKPVDDHALLAFLIQQGLRVSAADELTEALRRIRLLAQYYYDNWKWQDIREHETRTFLVIPLLLALGWAEQQLKIELPAGGGRVDIACFPVTFQGNNADAIVLIETKGFASGLDYAPEQAHAYAKHFTNCEVVLVTNGYCYKTYLRNSEGTFSTQPSGYLNIMKPRDRYSLQPEHVAGALEVLKWLMPTNVTLLARSQRLGQASEDSSVAG